MATNSSKQPLPPPKKKKNGQPPPIDKLIIPAIGIGLALLAYQFFKGIKSEIPRVNVEDELELRQIFFGESIDATPTATSNKNSGKSYAVLCHDENSTLPISSVFQDAYNDGSAPADFRIVDCNYVLPASNKTIASRFSLDLKQRPTVFLSGTVGPPKQISTKALKTGSMLVKYLKSKLEARASKIETTQDLRTHCLDKDICGLLLKGEKKAPNYLKDAMQKLLAEHPNVAFAAIDSSVLYVLNLEEYLPELHEASPQPRFVVFRKLAGSATDPKGERLKTSIATIPSNDNGGAASYGSMSNLVASVVSKKAEMTKLSSLPLVKTRTKKLVEEERAKRMRRAEQQKRANEKAQASSSSQFQANDGSRDGRRAERDRRRQEHREANNVRERTPEELAEMERKRRERMEAEAAKWNVAPDDLPPTGDAVYDDEDDNFDDYDTVVEEGGDEDHGDDVIDLD